MHPHRATPLNSPPHVIPFLSTRCHSGNLNGHHYNGPYQAVTDDGLVWYTWHGYWYTIKSVVMMIRPEGLEEPEAGHEQS